MPINDTKIEVLKHKCSKSQHYTLSGEEINRKLGPILPLHADYQVCLVCHVKLQTMKPALSTTTTTQRLSPARKQPQDIARVVGVRTVQQRVQDSLLSSALISHRMILS